MPREKLTPQQRDQVKRLCSLGVRPVDVARYFGITDSGVLVVCKDSPRPSTNTFVELLLKLMPYLPHKGPPLPRCLGIKWEDLAVSKQPHEQRRKGAISTATE